jgi:transcription initiation factor TFIIE subunit alpha
MFLCQVCGTEVDHDTETEAGKNSEDVMQRFNHAIQWVTQGLKKSEEMVVPAYVHIHLKVFPSLKYLNCRFDPAGWIQAHLTGAVLALTPGSGDLKIAGSSGATRVEDVGIVMSLDTSEAERQAERERLSNARRAQNAMPEWHKKSTISGALTAVGLEEEEARKAQVQPGDLAKSSGDELLKGLGVVGAPAPLLQISQEVDVKPTLVTNDSDCEHFFPLVYRNSRSTGSIDVDQYYASLELAASASAQVNTPKEEEEDDPLQISVTSLVSGTSSRKRSRSLSDEGPLDRAKTPRVDPTPPLAEGEEPADVNLEDDPIVYGMPAFNFGVLLC